MSCLHCHQKKVYRRGLCWSCYFAPAARADCRHCKQYGPIFHRGLCRACWRNREVRQLYPPDRRGRPPEVRHEPTTEEIEALVAAGYANLPAWWAQVREPRGTPEPYVRRVVKWRPNRRPSTVGKV